MSASIGQAAFPFAANKPRSALRNREALPLSRISRLNAACSVACGVLPPGLVQRPFLDFASISALAFIGSLDSTSTLAAASRPDIRLALGCLVALAITFAAL